MCVGEFNELTSLLGGKYKECVFRRQTAKTPTNENKENGSGTTLLTQLQIPELEVFLAAMSPLK